MVDDPLTGWGLRPVELTDRPALDPYFASLSQPLSDYTFSQLFTWRNSLRIAWTVLEGHLCVFANGTGDLTLLLPPVGDTNGDKALAAAFDLMDAYNARAGVPHRSRVEYVSEELLARFGAAHLATEPMGFDYLYDVNRMIDLAGGDLASKRQAKNRFTRLYEHRVEPYDAAKHLEPCRALLNEWKQHQDAQHASDVAASTNETKRLKESRATELCLEAAPDLGHKGLVVYVKDPAAGGDFAVRGFTFGEYLGRDQSSITIEKTDLTVKGLAQFIFSDFCRTCWADRPLVNVGDDWGLETLAWTKNSYRPIKLLKKYTLRKQAAVMATTPQTGEPEQRASAPVEEVAAPAEVVRIVPTLPALQGMTPMPVRVRPADKSDVEAAIALEEACFGEGVRFKKRQLQYLQQRDSAVFLVAEQGDELVGQGIALVRQHRTGKTGRIYSLAVRQASRGQKIGHRLLRAMLDALAERGVRRVYLEVEHDNEAASRLYAAHGFRSIGKLPDYYGPGRDATHMMAETSPAAVNAER